jgi:hypothetical protein
VQLEEWFREDLHGGILGCNSAGAAIRGEACHFVSTLAAVDIVRYYIHICINNAFNDVPVALNTNDGGVFNYGFESHEPSKLQLTNHTMGSTTIGLDDLGPLDFQMW